MGMEQHAYALEGEMEAGIAAAGAFIERELGLPAKGNPDVIVLRYPLFSPEDARRVAELAAQKPAQGERKAIVIAALRAYHEAQNALLKLFEEPPPGIYLFLALPSLGSLLPTLRSRLHILDVGHPMSNLPEEAREFIVGGKERRAALIKKLTSGRDDEERRENRDALIAILNGLEAAAYEAFRKERGGGAAALLRDISILRGYAYDRSAPVKLMLEHLALVAPAKKAPPSK